MRGNTRASVTRQALSRSRPCPGALLRSRECGSREIPARNRSPLPAARQLGQQQSVFECGLKRACRGAHDMTLFAAVNHHANEGTATSAVGKDRRAANSPIASTQSSFDRCRHRRRQTWITEPVPALRAAPPDDTPPTARLRSTEAPAPPSGSDRTRMDSGCGSGIRWGD
jgi:hypothetical protein